MVTDVVHELGFLTLGTRFRRIGENLQAQTQAVLAEHGIELPAAYFPLLAALDRLGPLSVGDLSLAVGVSQPVVTRSLRGLAEDDLVQSKTGISDRRVREVGLSPKGQALVRRAKRDAWRAIEAAVAQACAGLTGDLLTQLTSLEQALVDEPLLHRMKGARK